MSSLKASAHRSLQQVFTEGPEPSTGTQVTNAKELQAAVQSGEKYIEITEHLDLRGLDPVESFLLVVGNNGTVSIRGNCAEEPKIGSWNLEGEPLAARSPMQCVLVVDVALLKSTAKHLWLHKLMIRHQVSKRANSTASELLTVTGAAEGLWLTHVTFQGQGKYDQDNQEGCKAVHAERPVYLEGAYMLHLGGSKRVMVTNSTVAVVNSRIQDNSMFDVMQPLLATSGPSTANSTSSGSGGAMWLRGTLIFSNKVVLPMLASNGSQGFFSNVPREYFSQQQAALVATTEPPEAIKGDFLTRGGWLKNISESIPGVVLQTAIRDQATFDASVTTVATPLALQKAVQGGARHIRITQHGDLRNLESMEAPEGGLLGPVSSATFTIQGRCSKPSEDLEITGAPLRELLPRQCLLIADRMLLKQYVGRLWLDNVYVRVQPTKSTPSTVQVIAADASGGEMWVTRTTIQGDGSVAVEEDMDQVGLMGLASQSHVYGHAVSDIMMLPPASNTATNAGIDIADVGGNTSAAAFGATASLAACTFSNNTFMGLSASSIAASSGSHVWLQDVTLDAAQGPLMSLVTSNGGNFYSNVPVPVGLPNGMQGGVEGPVPPDEIELLRASDPWIVSAAAEINQHIVPFEDLPSGSPRGSAVAPGPGVAIPKGTSRSFTSEAPSPAPDLFDLSQPEAAFQDSATSTENSISIPWWVYASGAALLAIIALSITVVLVVIQQRNRKRMHELHAQEPALDSSLAASEPPAGQYGESLAATADGSLPLVGRHTRSVLSHGNRLALGTVSATGTHSHTSSTASSVVYTTAAVERFEQVATVHDTGHRESTGTLVSPMVPGLQSTDDYIFPSGVYAAHVRSSTQGSARKGAIDWSSEVATNAASPASTPWFGTISSKTGSDHPLNWNEGSSGAELGSILGGRDSLNGGWGSQGRGGGGFGANPEPWLLGSAHTRSGSAQRSHDGRTSGPGVELPPSTQHAVAQDGSTHTSAHRHTALSQGSTAGFSTAAIALDGTPSMVWGADAKAALRDKKVRLRRELDHLRSTAELFLGKYVVLSANEQREGGQGLVQFMRSALSEEAVAVKFFLSRSAFEQEIALYSNEVLKGMMPGAREVVGNMDGSAMSSRGHQWPPFIVLEKGESLQEWSHREEARYSTIMDALNLITEKLAKLHASGWVHRDLKPANVLRLPSHHSWTLMDFGCAAEQGAEVPIVCSLAYAPPEVVQLIRDGEQKIIADKSTDIWALGVIAFELLTQSRVFDPHSSSEEEATRQLCGWEPLPWEEGAEGCDEKLQMLKGLRGAVLRCLHREPKSRLSAAGVQQLLSDLFEVSAGISQFDVTQPAI